LTSEDVHFRPFPHDGKVVSGKDGWLFLDKDSNRIIAQHTGALRLTDEQLEQWRSLLEERIRWLEARGVPFIFLVPPNPHSVHPEMLPEHVPSAAARPIHQLIEHLEATGSPARVVYPLEELVSERDRHVYQKTGTHWTELGAFVAYERLLAELDGVVRVRSLSSSGLVLSEELKSGDLGNKVRPTVRSTFVRAAVRAPEARLVADNRVANKGRRREYVCDAAPGVTCLVLGDSYSYRMLPFLAESFGRLVFAFLPNLDRDLVEHERPDVVISVLNERFLIYPPVDEGAMSLAQWEAEKRAEGKLLPPPRFERAAGGRLVDDSSS
jgi:acetyltransferase AlgX (SGNH hydrolase-like protein)